MPKYRVTTESGVYEVTTADAPDVSQASTGVDRPSTNSALSMAGARGLLPIAENMAAEFGTNPNIPKIGAAVGRTLGGAAPVAAAMSSGNPVAMAMSPANIASGSWAGGRTGWHTAKLAQGMVRPVASLLGRLQPLAEKVGALAGPQGFLDLAQMAEPKRKDIGFLGIGFNDTPSEPAPLVKNVLDWMSGKTSPNVLSNLVRIGPET